jgi:diguanylate cyclase (GGDEF)-like protein
LLHAPEEQLHRLHLSLQREPRHGPLHRITGLFEHQGPGSRESEEALVPQVDPLTGVANRAGLEIEANAALEAARRGGRTLALLFLDLDRFKPVNDTLGHQAGDELLRVVAERLLASVRGSDLVARQGGDEFIVVLSEVHRPQDAALVAQKIIDSVMRPIAVGGQSVQVGCSIGIALLSESCPDFTSLMRAADTAMYAAKDAGRNTYRFYSDAFYLRIQRRVELEQDLRRALQREELFLVYQPTVRLQDGRTGNIEALMRWRSSDGSLRQPAEFVPLAEEIGEILPIGRWVVVEACRQAQQWIAQGLPFDRMAINVSGRQLRDPDFARHVLDACTGCGLSPSRLEIELAESSLLVDRDASRRTLGLLQAEGVTVSIDDFGAAFSNLIYLDRFQIKAIKLDRHFALGMQDDPALRDLTEAVIAMGHALRLRMVAKGVESEQAVRFLADHGCDEAQGFQFARPMPAADIPLWSSTREVARWAILASSPGG